MAQVGAKKDVSSSSSTNNNPTTSLAVDPTQPVTHPPPVHALPVSSTGSTRSRHTTGSMAVSPVVHHRAGSSNGGTLVAAAPSPSLLNTSQSAAAIGVDANAVAAAAAAARRDGRVIVFKSEGKSNRLDEMSKMNQDVSVDARRAGYYHRLVEERKARELVTLTLKEESGRADRVCYYGLLHSLPVGPPQPTDRSFMLWCSYKNKM
jgi:hypothetical protein